MGDVCHTRDDLRLAMTLLRKSEIEQPLQFDNFRSWRPWMAQAWNHRPRPRKIRL